MKYVEGSLSLRQNKKQKITNCLKMGNVKKMLNPFDLEISLKYRSSTVVSENENQ